MRTTPTLLLPLAFLLACGGDKTQPSASLTSVQPPANGRAEFTALPVDLTPSGTIEPLGHLAPVGHTLPTDHVYYYPIDYDHPPATRDTISRTVYAPAAGTLFFTFPGTGGEMKLMFRATTSFYWYVDHVIPRGSLAPGTSVSAGEPIGRTSPGGSIDLGAFDMSAAPQPYANPKRYPDQTNYTVSPFRYYVEPLRSQLYARQRRLSNAPPDAPIAFDKPGRLIGNWFDESLASTPDGANGPSAWPKQIAFVYDNRDPSQPRISIGGSLSSPFIGTVPANAPRFEDVSPASGKVIYSIRYTESTNAQFGLLIVQMLADDRIRIEIFENPLATSADFDTNARVYAR